MNALIEPRRYGTEPVTAQAELLSVKQVATLLGKSQRFIWSLHSRALLPAPVRLGRSVNWKRREIDQWIEWNCPSREEFEKRLARGAALRG